MAVLEAPVRKILPSLFSSDLLRRGLQLAGREAAWSVDIFLRLTTSVLALRLISRLVASSWMPKGAWEASPQVLQGFTGTKTAEVKAGEATDQRPQLLFEQDGERYYRHDRIFPGQVWACPLVKVEECRTCRWFVMVQGQPQCAVVAKVRTRHHEFYGRLDLFDMLEELKAQAARTASNGFGS